MTKKLSTEFVKEQIRKLGHEPLFDEYINSSSKILCKCIKHGEFTTTYSRICKIIKSKKGNGCRKCSNERKKVDIEDVRNLIIKLGHIPCFKEYVNCESPLRCICKKHGEFYITLDSVRRILNGKNPYANGCMNCWREIQRNDTRSTFLLEQALDIAPRSFRRCRGA